MQQWVTILYISFRFESGGGDMIAEMYNVDCEVIDKTGDDCDILADETK